MLFLKVRRRSMLFPKPELIDQIVQGVAQQRETEAWFIDSLEEWRRAKTSPTLYYLGILLAATLLPDTMKLAIIVSIIVLVSIQASSNSFVDHQKRESAADARSLKQVQDHQVHCSRERSRMAWEIIQEYLTPFVEREKYQLSRQCRLHPANDVFRDQEEHKTHYDINEWKCGYCKKSFRAEKFIDQHFDNRHYNLLNVSDGKCLAELCGALHCDTKTTSKSSKTRCNPAAAAKNKHLCESLANSCFPVNQGASASRLHELFLRQFCDAHTCSRGNKPFPRGGKKHTSIFYLAISILTLMLLPIFYLIVFLYQRENRGGTQGLRRISQLGRKTKPS